MSAMCRRICGDVQRAKRRLSIVEELKMKNETYEELFERSFKTKDRFVTPLILDYYNFETPGISEENVLDLIEKKYRSLS
jgi:hypothetical protein